MVVRRRSRFRGGSVLIVYGLEDEAPTRNGQVGLNGCVR